MKAGTESSQGFCVHPGDEKADQGAAAQEEECASIQAGGEPQRRGGSHCGVRGGGVGPAIRPEHPLLGPHS